MTSSVAPLGSSVSGIRPRLRGWVPVDTVLHVVDRIRDLVSAAPRNVAHAMLHVSNTVCRMGGVIAGSIELFARAYRAVDGASRRCSERRGAAGIAFAGIVAY